MAISFVNALVVRMALMGSNVVILPLMWVMKKVTGRGMSPGQTAMIYHQMGPIGAEIAHLDRSNRSKITFTLAIMACMFTIYYMQTGCYFMWNISVMPSIRAGDISDFYFGLINLVEFIFFIFIRTRISIKYFPKFVTIINIMFLFYLNSYVYGAQWQMFSVMIFTSLFVFCSFIRYFEQPAMTVWNPFSEYTPNMQHPRAGYVLTNNDTSYGTGFAIWTIFMPLRDRQWFN